MPDEDYAIELEALRALPTPAAAEHDWQVVIPWTREHELPLVGPMEPTDREVMAFRCADPGCGEEVFFERHRSD